MVMPEGLFFFAKFSILKTYCLLQGTILHPKTIVRYAVELTPYAIFDMDGTLIDTMPVHARAWNMVGEQFGYRLCSSLACR